MNENLSEIDTSKQKRLGYWGLSTFLVVLISAILAWILYLTRDEINNDILQNPHIVKHALLVLALLFLIIGAINVLIIDGKSRAKKWMAELRLEEDRAELKFSATVTGSTESQKRLKDQLQFIRDRAKHHFSIMAYFYVRYYMSIITFSLLAMLAAITFLFIGKNGWDQVNPYVVTSFIVLTASSAFFGAFPSVFRQNQNIADNKALYIQHVNLEQMILSYGVTGRITKGEKIELDDFIHFVDGQMEKIHNIAVGFDYTKVPNYTNVLNTQQGK